MQPMFFDNYILLTLINVILLLSAIRMIAPRAHGISRFGFISFLKTKLVASARHRARGYDARDPSLRPPDRFELPTIWGLFAFTLALGGRVEGFGALHAAQDEGRGVVGLGGGGEQGRLILA